MNRPRHHPAASITRTRAYWTCYAATAASAVVSLGYSVAATRPGGLTASDPLYATSRSAALATFALSAPRWRTGGVLLAAAATMTLVQALDAVIGLTVDDPVKIAGPAATAALTAITALLYARSRHAQQPVGLEAAARR